MKSKKTQFFKAQLEQDTMPLAAFFITKSERAETLDLQVSDYGLSFEIFKSKKRFAPLGFVGALADALLRMEDRDFSTPHNVEKG